MGIVWIVVLIYVAGFIITFIGIHLLDTLFPEDERLDEGEVGLIIGVSAVWPITWVALLIYGMYCLLKQFSTSLTCRLRKTPQKKNKNNNIKLK